MRYQSPVVDVRNGHTCSGSGTSSRILNPSRKRSRRKPIFTSFNVLLFLAVFEALLLLVVGIFSDHESLSSWVNPLEKFMVTSYHNHITNEENDDLLEMEEHLAKRTEKRLASEQFAPNDDELTSGTPLDDYYSRKHLSRAPVPVIVGGSDGSGTRAFVDVLAQLGVPMLVDDQGTMDIHAEEMFDGQGWPPLAKMVLQEKHSAYYEVESLSKETRKTALPELQRLTKSLNKRYKRLMRKASEANIPVASKVTYGYKAPVSMILVPLLKHVNKRMKYIHVVRDGRDVALSSNQSPVKKFYNDSYSDSDNQWSKYMHTDFAPVLGMQLWNDWNTDLLEWEHVHADGKHFDFLVMRTEDLLNPEKKFESLVQLSDFLGSPRTLKELCCLSQKAVTDMGMSEQNGRRGRFRNIMDKVKSINQGSGVEGAGGGASQWLRSRLQGGVQGAFPWNELGERPRGSFMLHGEPIPGDYLSKAKEQEADQRSARFKMIARRVAERARQKHEAGHDRQSDTARRRLSSFRREADVIPVGGSLIREHMLLGGPGAMMRPRHSMRLNRGKKADATFADGKRNEEQGAMMRPSHFKRLNAEQEAGLRDFEMAVKNAPSVTERYGKWAKILKEKPEVAAQLHVVGNKGLAAFGYEPNALFMDRDKQNTEFHCDDTVVCEDTQ